MHRKNIVLIMVLLAIAVITLFALASCATTGGVAVSGLVSLDEALTEAAEHLGNRVQGRTEIVIAGIDTTVVGAEDFLTAELADHLLAGGQFIVLERGNALSALETEHQFQMSGMVSDQSAVGIGRYLGAKVVLTGSFSRFANFSQFRLRALDIETSQVLTQYSARIHPNDIVLANVLEPPAALLPVVREDALVHLNRGKDLMAEWKLDEAIREFDRAIAIDGSLADAYSYRGIAHAEAYLFATDDTLENDVLDYVDQAIADLDHAIQLNPNDADAYTYRGMLSFYSIFGPSRDGGIADFTQAIRLKTNDARAYALRGSSHHQRGNFDQAIEDYSQAIRLNPDYAWAYYERGNAYYAKGNLDQAIADYEAVLRINPNHAQTRNNLEAARRQRGR